MLVSHGKHQRIESRADAPMEIPRQEIAPAREVADAIPVEDDDVAMEEEPQPLQYNERSKTPYGGTKS